MEYLTIIALGENQSQLISKFTELAGESQCSIEIGQMALLGSELSVSLLLAGEWNSIAKLEAKLPALEKQLNITAIAKRTQLPKKVQDLLPYTAQAIGLDQSNNVHELCHFFSSQAIPVFDLQTSASTAKQTETRIFSLTMNLGIPTKLSITDLRERFILLCEELNVDGILEPDRR